MNATPGNPPAEKKPAAKKKALAPILTTIGMLIMGGAIGLFGAMYIDTLTGGEDALFFVYLAVLLAGLYLAFCVQIVLHEAGHLVFGLMTGYRFVSFNIMGFIWQKDASGKLRFGRMQIAGAGGQCLMAPPDYNGGQFPFTLYNLGGVLMNLITAGLFALLLPLTKATPVLHILVLPEILVGVFYAIMNGLPIPVAAIQNDGKNLLCIRKDETARRAFWMQMSVAASLAQGVRIKDMPEEWFAPAPEDKMDNTIISAVAVMNTSRLMDALRLEEAEAEIRKLLAREKGVLDLYRMAMACDGAVCELVNGRCGSLTAMLEDKSFQQMMTAMKTNPAIIRTRYALALLKDSDAQAAQKHLADFEKAAKTHPNPQEVEGERELLALIDDVANRTEAQA